MNTLRIIAKEFKQQIRDWKANSLVVAFPLLLMVILGAAVSSQFGGMTTLPKVKALYSVRSSGPVASAFRTLVHGAAAGGVRFTETTSDAQGKQAVQNAEYSAYVVVGERRIELYRNDRYPIEAGVVKSILTAFLLRYNSAVVAATSLPVRVAGSPPVPTAASYVEVHSLARRKAPGSTDYYAVTMLTLMLMYAAIMSASRVRSEKRLGTANRILAAPVGRTNLLTGKVVGSLLTLAVQAAVLVAFSRYVLGAYWGGDILTVSALLLAEALMVAAMGIAVAYLLPSEGATAGVLNVMIPVFGFFGGAYVPLDAMGSFVQRMGIFSPIKWINQALFGVIYNGDYSAVGTAVLINLGIAALFILVAASFSRKEAYR